MAPQTSPNPEIRKMNTFLGGKERHFVQEAVMKLGTPEFKEPTT